MLISKGFMNLFEWIDETIEIPFFKGLVITAIFVILVWFIGYFLVYQAFYGYWIRITIVGGIWILSEFFHLLGGGHQ